MTNEQVKHLEFIQSIISRMNTNSFQIKAWTVTLVSALLAIFASTKNDCFVLVAVFPAVVLWFLDSYYLMQERKFRGLYNDVAGVSEHSKQIKIFAMRPDLYTGGKYSYWSTFTSVTILTLYLSIIIGLASLYIYLQCFVTKGT
ncbi:MAG: hypothetical protein IH984_06835 [Planctomycetes bacterium]|nr:hypothetical protein [Planctomycetota bacterium]